MQNEIMLLNQRIDELESKLDICCGDMDKATRKIQRFTRGHQSRKDTKIMKRGKQPNITDALLDMPKDVGDLITTQRNKIPAQIGLTGRLYKEFAGKTNGWTKINGASSGGGENLTPEAGSYLHPVDGHGRLKSIESGKALSDSSGGRIGGFDLVYVPAGNSNLGGVWPRAHTHNEMIQNLRTETQTDLYISPGASMKLLREKEEEGFEIEYDPIDRIGAASIKKKTNKKKKKKKKRN